MARKSDEPAGLVATVASGDRLAGLREIRDLLARALAAPDVPTRELAALSRQLTLVMAEIAELAPAETGGTALDELNRRRVARGSAPARQSRAGRT